MTRKDYELIASTINKVFRDLTAPTQELAWRQAEIKSALVHDFGMALNEANPRFNATQFIKACNK